MPSLPALSHEDIRKAIHYQMTETDLPSAVIALDVYSGRAWDDVLRRDPLAPTYAEDSDNARHVKRATEYLVAARLAEGWNPVSSERWVAGGATYEYRGPVWDAASRAATLREWAQEEFAAYLEPAGTVDFPTGFLLAHGYRGR